MWAKDISNLDAYWESGRVAVDVEGMTAGCDRQVAVPTSTSGPRHVPISSSASLEDQIEMAVEIADETEPLPQPRQQNLFYSG